MRQQIKINSKCTNFFKILNVLKVFGKDSEIFLKILKIYVNLSFVCLAYTCFASLYCSFFVYWFVGHLSQDIVSTYEKKNIVPPLVIRSDPYFCVSADSFRSVTPSQLRFSFHVLAEAYPNPKKICSPVPLDNAFVSEVKWDLSLHRAVWLEITVNMHSYQTGNPMMSNVSYQQGFQGQNPQNQPRPNMMMPGVTIVNQTPITNSTFPISYQSNSVLAVSILKFIIGFIQFVIGIADAVVLPYYWTSYIAFPIWCGVLVGTCFARP